MSVFDLHATVRCKTYGCALRPLGDADPPGGPVTAAAGPGPQKPHGTPCTLRFRIHWPVVEGCPPANVRAMSAGNDRRNDGRLWRWAHAAGRIAPGTQRDDVDTAMSPARQPPSWTSVGAPRLKIHTLCPYQCRASEKLSRPVHVTYVCAVIIMITFIAVVATSVRAVFYPVAATPSPTNPQTTGRRVAPSRPLNVRINHATVGAERANEKKKWITLACPNNNVSEARGKSLGRPLPPRVPAGQIRI